MEEFKDSKDIKVIAIALYQIYMAQANQNNVELSYYHENEHDNSGSHPDYHNDSHDNTPGKMLNRSLTKNVAN